MPFSVALLRWEKFVVILATRKSPARRAVQKYHRKVVHRTVWIICKMFKRWRRLRREFDRGQFPATRGLDDFPERYWIYKYGRNPIDDDEDA